MKNSKDILSLDAQSLSAALESKSLTCEQVMEATLERIEQVNGQHNAIIQMRGDRKKLLQLARIADETHRKGWLHGIPIAIKDLSNVKGLPTSMGGSPLFKDFVPEKSDYFVEQIENAGAIIIGKTNAPECGIGSHTYNSRWGRTLNPFDMSKSAGGSSGGAAVAVATRMLCLADGSDMMGSLRNPAGWNNLYSHRPTAGIVPGDLSSRKNPLPYPISTPGPIGRNPIDCALLLQTMIGDTSKFDASSFLSNEDKELKKESRIGWLGDWNGGLPFEDGILSHCRDTLNIFREQQEGVEIVDIYENPSTPWMMPLAKLWKAWNTVRFALAAEKYASAFDKRILLDDSSIKEELKWEIRNGLLVTEQDLKSAKQIQEEYSIFLDSLFEQYGFLALPSAQVWPFPGSETWPRSIGNTHMDTYHRWMEVCVPVSFGGLPCLTIPVGFGGRDGLPMGVQLFARRGHDMELFRLAQAYHKLTDWPSTAESVDDENASLRYSNSKY